jgi:hypothetical protein
VARNPAVARDATVLATVVESVVESNVQTLTVDELAAILRSENGSQEAEPLPCTPVRNAA